MSLKGVRRELYKSCPTQHATPIDTDTRNKRRAGRHQEPLEPTVITPQGGDDDGLSVAADAVVEGVFDPGDQRGMRTGLDERAVAVLARAAHRLVELHSLPDVAVPVVGIQTAGVQTGSGHRRKESSTRRTRLDAAQNRDELSADRLHLSRMRRIVDIDPAGAQIQVRAEADELLEHGHFTRYHDRCAGR